MRGKERLRRRVEGCISTPIPNYLSTLLYCSKKPKNTQNKVKNERKQCGKEERSGVGMEQMRRMDEMVWRW